MFFDRDYLGFAHPLVREQENLTAETDGQIGSGRSIELVLRAGRRLRGPAGTKGEHNGQGAARGFGKMPRSRIALETEMHSP